MSAADVRIAEKRGQAAAAREALIGTVEEIKARLAPATLAHEAWEGAKGKGVAAAEGAVDTVKQRPVLTAGIAAAAALILARKPVVELLTGLFADRDGKPTNEKEE